MGGWVGGCRAQRCEAVAAVLNPGALSHSAPALRIVLTPATAATPSSGAQARSLHCAGRSFVLIGALPPAGAVSKIGNWGLNWSSGRGQPESVLRFGGSGNDALVYEFGSTKCPPPGPPPGKDFAGDIKCLNQTWWRNLLGFANASNARIVFGARQLWHRFEPYLFFWFNCVSRACLSYTTNDTTPRRAA